VRFDLVVQHDIEEEDKYSLCAVQKDEEVLHPNLELRGGNRHENSEEPARS